MASGANSIVSIVADSWDYYNFLHVLINTSKGGKLTAWAQQNGVRIVVRPDSGNPPEVIKKTLEYFERHMQIQTNALGYKLLPKWLGGIYGDSMSREMIQETCRVMAVNGWAVDGRNFIYGCGGALMQKINRDTSRYAFKCSAARTEGPEFAWFDVFKQPKTDPSKDSKRGRLKLLDLGSEDYPNLVTANYDHPNQDDQLVEVFRDGEILVDHTFEEIRGRTWEPEAALA